MIFLKGWKILDAFYDLSLYKVKMVCPISLLPEDSEFQACAITNSQLNFDHLPAKPKLLLYARGLL